MDRYTSIAGYLQVYPEKVTVNQVAGNGTGQSVYWPAKLLAQMQYSAIANCSIYCCSIGRAGCGRETVAIVAKAQY